VTYLEGHCLSYGAITPYLPVLGTLRHLCAISDRDAPAVIATKVHRCLQHLGIEVTTWAPYLLHLLGVSADAPSLARLTPEAIRERTFEALRQVHLQSSRQQALIVAIENLHWIDPTSEAWLTSLAEQLAGAPCLLLGTYRPGYRPPWMDKSYLRSSPDSNTA
jgi:predicted ATPase